jgi:hypothetical protein
MERRQWKEGQEMKVTSVVFQGWSSGLGKLRDFLETTQNNTLDGLQTPSYRVVNL